VGELEAGPMVQTIFVAILAGTGRGALPIICLQQGQLQISLVAVRKKASCWKYSVELPSRMALPLLPIEWKFEVDFGQFILQWPIRLLN